MYTETSIDVVRVEISDWVEARLKEGGRDKVAEDDDALNEEGGRKGSRWCREG